jgi:S1-C subfamily serine protease
MFHGFSRWALALVALACVTPESSSAQEVSAGRTGAGSGIEFSYRWEGGFTIAADGTRRMRSYPTVKSVVPTSPAARAGLRANDIIVSTNGRDARTPPLFQSLRPGAPVVLRVRRGSDEREITFIPRRPAR